VDAAKPRYTTGAIGAVSQSIADLKSRSVIEVDPRMIDTAGLHDRLGEDGDLAALVESIRTYGQQVPVLLRPNPNDAERYQVVYGRRRVAALKQLGQPVKALVRILDDRELVIAQGQENSARKDLTFIEKANFARQMVAAGYERKVICDALHMDKTLISRMLSVADRTPLPLIEAIGSAPGIGRDRWLALADLLEKTGNDGVALAVGETSDKRFEAVIRGLSKPKPQKPPPTPAVKRLRNDNGVEIATADRRKNKMVLTINSKNADGFDDWLVTHLAEIHRNWKDSTGG
jgi:ParB family chromosome partitioning protein